MLVSKKSVSLTREEEDLMQDNQALVNLSHQIIGRMEQFLHQELHELEFIFSSKTFMPLTEGPFN